METNWILITIVIIAAILLIIFLIQRNQKDKKALTRTLISEEEASIPTETDKENDQIGTNPATKEITL
jgi:flagellar biosynthesis/type III secretory pathway M-ring protein FliF/YscJ